jgi:hypothetical protein
MGQDDAGTAKAVRERLEEPRPIATGRRSLAAFRFIVAAVECAIAIRS